MLMPDVNVLINAYQNEPGKDERYFEWVMRMATGFEPFALSELVLQSYVRVVTNPKAMQKPLVPSEAFAFVDALANRPHCRVVRAGPRHWEIFRRLCLTRNVRGPMVSDVAHAAIAIETGCEWVTGDTDFARFAPELRWRLL